MQHTGSVDRAIANIERELARPAEREWFSRVKSERSDRTHEHEWSGASWAGQVFGGWNWAGGREH